MGEAEAVREPDVVVPEVFQEMAALATEEEAEISNEVTIVFRRGPDSPSPGSPVVAAGYDDAQNLRIIAAFFAFYRLPEDAQRTFALNAVSWLIGAEG